VRNHANTLLDIWSLHMRNSAKAEIDEVNKVIEGYYTKLGIPASDLVRI
jgi:hypothetical protein